MACLHAPCGWLKLPRDSGLSLRERRQLEPAVQLTDLKWPDVDALDRRTPVVIPIAALEQHGRHMPLFTDSILLGEVIRRVAAAMQDQVLFAPLMWLGNSEHHLDFPGTMTASPR